MGLSCHRSLGLYARVDHLGLTLLLATVDIILQIISTEIAFRSS